MSNAPADCLVVGSGIAGVCTALHIQRTGARVAIVDPDAPGSGASFGNAGLVVNTKLTPVFAGLTPVMLLKMLRNPASPLNVRWSRFLGLTPWFLRMLAHAGPAEVERITRALAELSRQGERIYTEMWEEAGMGDLVVRRGSLALYTDSEQLDRNWDGMMLTLQRSLGAPMERVGPAEIHSLTPTVSPRYTCGVYSPDFQHTLDPQAFVANLCALFLARGGAHVRAKILGVDVRNGVAAGLKTADGSLAGGSVVIAAGTGSANFAQQLGEGVPHQAVGGYHVMLGNPGVALETPLLPMDFRFAITPMRGGIRLAGTYDFGAYGQPPNYGLLDDMLKHVAQVLPGINAEKSSVWQGFRSYLPDGLPVISASRAARGVHYLFGFSSSGMINAAAASRALARMWNGDAPEIDMTPYAIDRFGGRRSPPPAANNPETRGQTR